MRCFCLILMIVGLFVICSQVQANDEIVVDLNDNQSVASVNVEYVVVRNKDWAIHWPWSKPEKPTQVVQPSVVPSAPIVVTPSVNWEQTCTEAARKHKVRSVVKKILHVKKLLHQKHKRCGCG